MTNIRIKDSQIPSEFLYYFDIDNSMNAKQAEQVDTPRRRDPVGQRLFGLRLLNRKGGANA